MEYLSFILLVYGYYIFPTINMYYFAKYKIMTLNQISKEKNTQENKVVKWRNLKNDGPFPES